MLFFLVRSALVRFLHREGITWPAVKRIFAVYGTPVIYHAFSMADPDRRMTECYYLQAFQMYAGLYFDMPECLQKNRYRSSSR